MINFEGRSLNCVFQLLSFLTELFPRSRLAWAFFHNVGNKIDARRISDRNKLNGLSLGRYKVFYPWSKSGKYCEEKFCPHDLMH